MLQVVFALEVVMCFLLLAPSPALGDLGAAVRRSASTGAMVHPASAPMMGPVVIPLVKEAARQPKDSETNFYVGEVSVGQPPQVLRVIFDTSSGSLLLPHRACRNITCLEHRRYSPWESSSAMDINADGEHIHGVQGRLAKGRHTRDVSTVAFTQSDLGEGEVQGVFVRDTVCMHSEGTRSSKACVDMAVLAATSMQETPFRAMPCDGIVGLGLQSLALAPIGSFLNRLFEGSVGVLPQFGIAMSGSHGELHLGGHDSAHLAAPLRWFPVDHPEQGYWQVAIQAVRVGNLTVDRCLKGCHGIVDTGVSRLGVQASRLSAVQLALGSSLAAETGHCGGPDLIFELGGMSLKLGPEDYAGIGCTLRLGSLDLPEPEFVGVYALGGALLHRYYAAFDWKQQRLGFAPLARVGVHLASGRSRPEEPVGVLMV